MSFTTIDFNNWSDIIFSGITSSYAATGTIPLLLPLRAVLNSNSSGFTQLDMNAPSLECSFDPGISQLRKVSGTSSEIAEI